MSSRKQKAIQIISEIKSIRKITANQFSVDSQTDGTKSYLVRKLLKTDIWTCECADFHYRLRKLDDKHCKHIKSCILLQNKTNIDKERPLPIDYLKSEKINAEIIIDKFLNVETGKQDSYHKNDKPPFSASSPMDIDDLDLPF